jgi:phospholipase/carboxylesterase
LVEDESMKPKPDDRQSSKPGPLETRDLGFVHVFVPAPKPAPNAVTLLLLHGAGGDERELLPLGRELWPGAALLGVRGHVLENGAPRFFCRLAEGGFDVYDLQRRTSELAKFIDAAAKQYGFSKRHLIAVGYTQGADIAASLIFLHPHYLAAAVLFRAQLPFWPDLIRNFSELSVFIAAGIRDPFVPRDQTSQLAAVLESGGADVSMVWHRGGHELGDADIAAAKAWLSERVKKQLAA